MAPSCKACAGTPAAEAIAATAASGAAPLRTATAREQLAAQLLSLRLLHIRHDDGLVRRAARRVDADAAHAEDALDERGVLVDGLDALVGHMHALLVEYARIQVEFLGP